MSTSLITTSQNHVLQIKLALLNTLATIFPNENFRKIGRWRNSF